MSIEFEREVAEQTVRRRESRLRQMRDRQRGVYQMRIKPSKVNELKVYYDEYLQMVQQDQYPIVGFNDWIISYTIKGWLNCRSKIKGK